MASAGPSHLTAEEVCQRVCDDSDMEESASDIEVQVIICDFVRCFGMTVIDIVVVREAGQSLPFCKQATRQVPYSLIARSQCPIRISIRT